MKYSNMEQHVSTKRQSSLLLNETRKNKANVLHKHDFRCEITLTFLKYIQ